MSQARVSQSSAWVWSRAKLYETNFFRAFLLLYARTWRDSERGLRREETIEAYTKPKLVYCSSPHPLPLPVMDHFNHHRASLFSSPNFQKFHVITLVCSFFLSRSVPSFLVARLGSFATLCRSRLSLMYCNLTMNHGYSYRTCVQGHTVVENFQKRLMFLLKYHFLYSESW